MSSLTPNLLLKTWEATDQKLQTWQDYNDNLTTIDSEIAAIKAETVWVNLTLQNGWLAGLSTPQYAVVGNRVIFRGRIKNGSLGGGSYIPAFTMPSNYLPEIGHAHMVAGYATNTWARIYSFTSGVISVITTASGATTDEIDLSQISYYYQ